MRVRLLAAGLLAAAATLPFAATAAATYCNPAFEPVCTVFFKACNAAGPCPVE